MTLNIRQLPLWVDARSAVVRGLSTGIVRVQVDVNTYTKHKCKVRVKTFRCRPVVQILYFFESRPPIL